MNEQRVEALALELLKEIGEDPSRDGLLRTPQRFAKALQFLTRGYRERVHDVVNNAIFESGSNNMVVLHDIDIFSLCEHHLLPFFGHCHVGYISRGRVLGVSKIARIADCLAARLQIQELALIVTHHAAKSLVGHSPLLHFFYESRKPLYRVGPSYLSQVAGDDDPFSALLYQLIEVVIGLLM